MQNHLDIKLSSNSYRVALIYSYRKLIRLQFDKSNLELATLVVIHTVLTCCAAQSGNIAVHPHFLEVDSTDVNQKGLCRYWKNLQPIRPVITERRHNLYHTLKRNTC